MNDFGFLVTVLIFLSIGIVCLFWPEKIQQYFLTHQGSGFSEKLNPFGAWMKTPDYVTTLRIIGVMAAGVAAFALWAITQRS